MSVRSRITKLEEMSGATISYVLPRLEALPASDDGRQLCRARWTSQSGDFEHEFERLDGEDDTTFEWRMATEVFEIAREQALPGEQIARIYPGMLCDE